MKASRALLVNVDASTEALCFIANKRIKRGIHRISFLIISFGGFHRKGGSSNLGEKTNKKSFSWLLGLIHKTTDLSVDKTRFDSTWQ